MQVFDSRNTKYKQPFGAAAVGETIQIMFPVCKHRNPLGVFIVLRGAIDARIRLAQSGQDDGYIYYSTTFAAQTKGLAFYRFEIKTQHGYLFVGRDTHGKAIIGDWLPEWQLTVYDNTFTTPQWLKGGLIYHIFADRFARIEDGKKPQFGYLKDWNKDIEVHREDGSYDANDFFGGNIKGIISQLDYIQGLGTTALYLSPIFQSSSNHRYDTGDYLQIDNFFGDEQEFVQLIAECKKRGIGIILDGVFNHTGADSIYFNKFSRYPSLGAYQSKDSPYHNWYTFYNFPKSYACWWGVTSVPSVRREALDFQEFIVGSGGVIDKWTAMGIAGWRLDVVDELSSDFVKKIRTAIKRHGGEKVVIGEVWEDASTKTSYGESREYLFGQELDGIMNYSFRTAIVDYIKTADAYSFAASVNEIIENYPKQALDCCMTLIGTHDTVRAINLLSSDTPPHSKAAKRAHKLSQSGYQTAKKRLMLAACLQYFLPGVPTLYYGDETALQGYEDPMNRRPYPWGQEDQEVLSHYRTLGELRRRNRKAFCTSTLAQWDGSVVSIDRGGMVLLANATSHPMPIPPVQDLLTNQQLCHIPPESAVIYLHQP